MVFSTSWSWKHGSVTWIFFTMLGIVALAALVVVYVAFPYRGKSVPKAPWFGEALQKGVEKLPTLDR